MGTKKSAPLETQEATTIEVLRSEVASLPLASQINTLLDEVERLAKVK